MRHLILWNRYVRDLSEEEIQKNIEASKENRQLSIGHELEGEYAFL